MTSERLNQPNPSDAKIQQTSVAVQAEPVSVCKSPTHCKALCRWLSCTVFFQCEILPVGLLDGFVLFSVEAQRGGTCHRCRDAKKRRLRQRLVGPAERIEAKKVRYKACGGGGQQKDFNEDAAPNASSFVNEALGRHFFQIRVWLQKSVNTAEVFCGVQQVDVAVWAGWAEALQLLRPSAEDPSLDLRCRQLLKRIGEEAPCVLTASARHSF